VHADRHAAALGAAGRDGAAAPARVRAGRARRRGDRRDRGAVPGAGQHRARAGVGAAGRARRRAGERRLPVLRAAAGADPRGPAPGARGGAGAQPGRGALPRARIPAALPQFLASARISIPGAIVGSMLAEWLVGFEGMGGVLSGYKGQGNYGGVWTIVALSVLVSIVLYE